MIELTNVNGKKLALVAWSKDDKGNDDVAVFTGIARWNGKEIFFDRGSTQQGFTFPEDWLERIKTVPQDIKDIVIDSEYYISLSVGDLSNDTDQSGFISTGLKWPEK